MNKLDPELLRKLSPESIAEFQAMLDSSQDDHFDFMSEEDNSKPENEH